MQQEDSTVRRKPGMEDYRMMMAMGVMILIHVF